MKYGNKPGNGFEYCSKYHQFSKNTHLKKKRNLEESNWQWKIDLTTSEIPEILVPHPPANFRASKNLDFRFPDVPVFRISRAQKKNVLIFHPRHRDSTLPHLLAPLCWWLRKKESFALSRCGESCGSFQFMDWKAGKKRICEAKIRI